MTPDVKALQATIEEGWAKAEQYSRTCTGEMGYARVHEDITAGREAYAALLQHVARLEDENRRLYSCVKFVASRHPDGNPKFAIEAAQELLASLAPTAAAPGGEVVG